MTQVVLSHIGEVDEALCALLEKRRGCTNPIDSLLMSVNIDLRLDERVQLMKIRDMHAERRELRGALQ
jgi:hypothetical protein